MCHDNLCRFPAGVHFSVCMYRGAGVIILSHTFFVKDELSVKGVRGQCGGPRSLLPFRLSHHAALLQAGGQEETTFTNKLPKYVYTC